MRYRTTRSTVITLLLVSIAACAVFGLAACGGTLSGASSPLASGLTMSALDDPNGGFSIRYPTDYIQLQPPVDSSKDPGLLDQVFLANSRGAMKGDTALDVLTVTVRQLSKVSRPGDLKKYKADFEAIASALIGKPVGLTMVAPFVMTTLGDLPALRVDYVFKVGGTDMAAVSYLVPAGDRVFWITGQASKATWGTSGPEMAASVATFAVDR
jgi:hypothetical protein